MTKATKGVDYAMGPPDAQQIGPAPRVIFRYITGRKGITPQANKDIFPPEVKRLHALGYELVLNFEIQAERPKNAPVAQGEADALAAERHADELGYPVDRPIIYSIDFDATWAQVRKYVEGLNRRARRPVGLYGPGRILDAAVKAGLCEIGWQACAWAGFKVIPGKPVDESTGTLSDNADVFQHTIEIHRRRGDGKMADWDENRIIRPGRLQTWTPAAVPPPPPPPPPGEEERPPDEPAPFELAKIVLGPWVTKESRQFRERGWAMIQERRKLFQARTGKRGPKILQGGRSGSVSASGGTHGREADDSSENLPDKMTKEEWWIWEECGWIVGFASWHRDDNPGVWGHHNHSLPKGGDLSSAAASQERAFRARRNGLQSNKPYPAIGRYADQTWETYLLERDGKSKIKIAGKFYPDVPNGELVVRFLVWAFRTGTFSRYSALVQEMLSTKGAGALYPAKSIDGKAGPMSRSALRKFQVDNGLAGDGVPTVASITLLAEKAKSPRKVIA